MEKNDNSNSSIHRSSTSNRTSSCMATPTLKKHDDTRSTTHPECICGVSNANNLNIHIPSGYITTEDNHKPFTHFHAFNIHTDIAHANKKNLRTQIPR
jgi:hypothetical protein